MGPSPAVHRKTGVGVKLVFPLLWGMETHSLREALTSVVPTNGPERPHNAFCGLGVFPLLLASKTRYRDILRPLWANKTWMLVYKVEKDRLVLQLLRTETHSDLF